MDGFLMVLFYFIESSLLVAAGPGLLGMRPRIGQILLVGLVHGLAVWGVRTLYQVLKIPFGSHTLILAIILFLCLWQLAKLPIFVAISGAAISVTLLLISEPLILIPFVGYLNLTFEQIMKNFLLFFPIALVGDSLLILAVILGFFLKKRAFNQSR
ncbi:MAG: hypothetical protein WA118_10665 [Carboxydocellales bacterium]